MVPATQATANNGPTATERALADLLEIGQEHEADLKHFLSDHTAQRAKRIYFANGKASRSQCKTLDCSNAMRAGKNAGGGFCGTNCRARNYGALRYAFNGECALFAPQLRTGTILDKCVATQPQLDAFDAEIDRVAHNVCAGASARRATARTKCASERRRRRGGAPDDSVAQLQKRIVATLKDHPEYLEAVWRHLQSLCASEQATSPPSPAVPPPDEAASLTPETAAAGNLTAVGGGVASGEDGLLSVEQACKELGVDLDEDADKGNEHPNAVSPVGPSGPSQVSTADLHQLGYAGLFGI